MPLSDLNAPGLECLKQMANVLDASAHLLSADAFQAVMEELNDEVTQMTLDLHHGKPAHSLTSSLLRRVTEQKALNQ
jgi:hypothetical protein